MFGHVRKVMRRVHNIVIIAVLSAACSELTDPRQDESATLEYRYPTELAALSDLKCMGGKCDIEFDEVAFRHTCVCHLPGVGTNPAPPPPAPPIWPIDWPTPPGVVWNLEAGGWSPPGGSASTCDPTQIDPPCFEYEAKLSCPVNIPRGNTGTCRIDAGGRRVTVSKWEFEGEKINNTWPVNSLTWEGPLIESGDVRADILVDGNAAVVRSRIEVSPRRSGKFTQSAWQSQMSFVPGQGKLDCNGTRPHFGKAVGWSGSLKSAQDGICEGNVIDPYRGTGYEVDIVPKGPNKGGIYIKTPTWYFKGTSQIHPGRDLVYPVTNSAQADLCRAKVGTNRVSFNTFNSKCKQVAGWSGFWDAVWRHEKRHWENGRDELLKSGNNMYIETEHCVGDDAAQNYPEFNKCVTEKHIKIQNAMRAKAVPEPTGFWNTTPWWAWTNDCKPGECWSNVFGAVDRKF